MEVWTPEGEPRCFVLTLCSLDYKNLTVSFNPAFTAAMVSATCQCQCANRLF